MIKRWLNLAAIMVVCLIHSIPIFVLLNVAFKSPQDTSSRWASPTYLYLDNFSNAWQQAHLDRALLNTAIITSITVGLIVLIGAAAAYPLARYPSHLNTIVYTVCVSCLIVPALSILVPLYKFTVDIQGINTYWAIILIQVTFALPVAIFLFTGFISTIPRELDDAGLIDGCNRFAIFYRIILPLLKPVTATVVILTGIGIWNDYQFSVFFLQKRAMQTVPVALSGFFSQYQNNLSWVAAGCIISMLPLAVLYLALQKYFVKGLAEGAVKG